MNKFKSNKLFALLIAISSVVIVAGIILYAVLGFNNAQDKPNAKYIDVTYGVTVVQGKVGEEDASAYLEQGVENVLKEKGLSYEKDSFEVGAMTSSAVSTNGQQINVRYTFAASASQEKLDEAVEAIKTFAAGETTLLAEADITVASHVIDNAPLKKAAWRGAIAIAVGAIVALAYVAIRFGVSCGVAGLAIAAHDALFTAAFFALTRIPVFGFAPLLYAAIAAFVSVMVWTAISIRIRSVAKDPANAGITAEELAGKGITSSWKYVVCLAAALAAILLVFGLVAAAGTRALVLPAIVACLVPVYSTLFIAPNIFVPIRAAFDKKRDAKKGGYVRKKKKAELEAEE